MRYDEELGLLSVGVYEMAKIARRCMAAVPISDEDEPKTEITSEKIKKRFFEGYSRRDISFDFSLGEEDFRLFASVMISDAKVMRFIAETDRNIKKIPKELKREMRAIAYLSAYVYSKSLPCDSVDTEIVFYSDETEEYEILSERIESGKLLCFFEKCKSALTPYAAPEIERVKIRLKTMKSLKFPHKSIRDSQREFMAKAYSEISHGGTLIAGAPTGTGKTVSALYPALRALGDGKGDKIFYFTPKTTIAEAAKKCLSDMERGGAKIRAIILKAKERVCKRGLLCRESRDNCENSKNKEISLALCELFAEGKTVITDKDILPVSQKYKVCPYELSLCYAELCDVVISDFNYLFDPKSYIRRFFDFSGNYIFLFDEAHNLPDRAREMFSSELSAEAIFSDLIRLSDLSPLKKCGEAAAESFHKILYPLVKEEIMERGERGKVGFAHTSEIPTELYTLFPPLLEACEEELYREASSRDNESAPRRKIIREYYYKLRGFYDAALRFDSHYELFIYYEEEKIRAKIFCVDPSREISKRLKLGSSAVFFSATLTPLSYYRALFGDDRSAKCLEVTSPFDPSQLSVSIMDKISTRYSERERTMPSVVRAIAAAISPKKGNYMIFTPSFEYSDSLAQAFRARYPKVRCIEQKRNMTEAEKTEYLNSLRSGGESYLVAFAVMGGIYSEGIDLNGNSLIGAVIVGIGMPTLSVEREAMRAYYDDRFDEGKLFAYVYPGMNRVLQAAGRVIRDEGDRGIIVLIDDRFDDPIYKKIIPSLWEGMRFIEDPRTLKQVIEEFWLDVYDEEERESELKKEKQPKTK